MNPTLTIDVDPGDLDYAGQDAIEFITGVFRRMSPSKQAEFLAEVYTKDVVLEDLISAYKALPYKDTLIFRRETRLINAENIRSSIMKIESFTVDTTEIIRQIKEGM